MRRFTIFRNGETKTARVLIRVVAMLVVALLGAVTVRAAQNTAPAQRADIYVIDTLSAFGPLERPPVLFFHDKHTRVSQKLGKDCTACHPADKQSGEISLKYQRLEDADAETVKEIYHTRCIACHKENPDAGERPGPVTCGECHAKDKPVLNIRKPISLDHSLHYRHVKANDKKCETCHHEYNAAAKKLFYAKGKEGACVYCHKEKTEENRIAYPLAAHMACVGCHRRLSLQGKDAGPMACGGCHDPKAQSIIVKLDDVPRLERGQPDDTLGRMLRLEDKPAPIQRSGVVPFDHKFHEGVTDQCLTCHHAAISRCAQCHTIDGDKDADGVKLGQAMHQRDAAQSCVGCHARRQMVPECAGCHSAMARPRGQRSETTCTVCHITLPAPVTFPMPDDAVRQLAGPLVAERKQNVVPTVAPEDIPDQVSIDHLKDVYEPVTLPHRKIVNALVQRIGNSRLAAAFHTRPATVCQGCHHHAPATRKPARCNTCHGRSSDALNPMRPGLMAAFHQECFQCHDQMGIAKPASRDCTACHAKRNS